MTKHVKGPWEIQHDSWIDGHVTINSLEHGALAHVVWEIEDDRGHTDNLGASAKCKANAHLIAAAPDLLEALEEAWTGLMWYHTTYPDLINECDHEAIERIEAAIKKAKGE